MDMLRVEQTLSHERPDPALGLKLHQSLEPLTVLRTFLEAASPCLPLAAICTQGGIALQASPARQWLELAAGDQPIRYGFCRPLSHRERQQLAHWHALLLPALGNALQYQAMVRQARTDALTGLGNRSAFEEDRARLRALCERTCGAISLALVDLDNFKPVNDRHGHQQGDRVLAALAQTLKAASRGSDAVYRIGGDEFALLLPQTNLAGAEIFGQRLLRQVADEPTLRRFGVGISLGLAQCNEKESDGDWHHRADVALYEAKDAGRGCLKKA
ncbi:GGDEF domain-containing protein [Gallaecimonas sp. GXIMD4217]|uniref:GGDEF domain-containing protein n=1 Tax=Gallaecimonas sp. GXIMD4217 TaxID=3131927 RepID=UPI00311ACFEF